MIFYDRLQKIKARKDQIEEALGQPDVASDPPAFQKLARELSQLRPLVDAFDLFLKAAEELEEVEKILSDPEADPEMLELSREELRMLQERKKRLTESLELLLLKEADPLSDRDVIMEIRAGTGGEEASLFAMDLFRMYSRFAAEHKLKVEVFDSSVSGKGGFKEIIFGVSGEQCYSLFKYESGIHRVQRVPETESSGRIHTSAVTVAVMAEAEDTDIEIDPSDLKIDVYRASGAGGQHVNKTESAVRITHEPTGVVVTCQDERSQHKNKAKAMRVLRARLFEAKQEKEARERAAERKQQVGSGDRSGKIRTYNFPDQRVTDHRIGLTLHDLGDILDGRLDELIQAMEQDERSRKLADQADTGL